MKLLISKSGRFISKHLQNRSNPYEGKVARRMNENTIPERTHGEITRKENAVIPRDYSVYGTPEQARTAGVPLRRWTQCIYSLSTEIKKMQLYQGISPHSL